MEVEGAGTNTKIASTMNDSLHTKGEVGAIINTPPHEKLPVKSSSVGKVLKFSKVLFLKKKEKIPKCTWVSFLTVVDEVDQLVLGGSTERKRNRETGQKKETKYRGRG